MKAHNIIKANSIPIAQLLKLFSMKIPTAEPIGKEIAAPNTKPDTKPIIIPSIKNMAVAPFKKSFYIDT